MSLSSGTGPLSVEPAGWFTPPLPEGAVYVEPHRRRIVGDSNGRTLIDTEHALMVHRRGHELSYAFLAEEVPRELPREPVVEAPGYVRVPWDAVESWFEEGRRLVHYPPNPYHRVDCRPSDRPLRVSVGGTVLVDTADTVIVFETAVATRLYVRPEHVRIDLLQCSPSSSYCNYKGYATYWSAVIDGAVHDDVAWTYDDTPPESMPIRGFFSFDEARADVVAALPE
ncbi:MAG: DUF427 domain-containing protein [Mycobacterium sp.]